MASVWRTLSRIVVHSRLAAARMGVAIVMLVAAATGCHGASKAERARGALLEAFGAPFDVWSDARIDRFGEQVCTKLDNQPRSGRSC